MFLVTFHVLSNQRRKHICRMSFWWSPPIMSFFRRLWLFSSSCIWWFTFAGVFNWALIDHLIISRRAGNSIRLQTGKRVPCPACCRVISAFAHFLSLTINPEMEARLPFPHSTLLHHYWTILCILWWKWTVGRVMMHPDFDSDLTLKKAASHLL